VKKVIWISGTVILCCVIISSFAIYGANQNYKSIRESSEKIDSADWMTTTYILKSEKNRIVVYEKGETQPLTVTETVVSVLPMLDQQRLKEGIEIVGEKQLKRMLKDYSN